MVIDKNKRLLCIVDTLRLDWYSFLYVATVIYSRLTQAHGICLQKGNCNFDCGCTRYKP